MGPNEQPPPNETSAARVRVLPPFVFLSWFVAAVIYSRVRHPWASDRFPHLRSVLAPVLFFGGIALVISCIRLMRRSGQNPSPKTPTPSLITTGPWRYMRNPIYLGMTSAALGLGWMVNNHWIGVSGLLALLTVHFTAVLPEEAYLTQRFGETYRQYQQHVRRYL